MTMFEIESAEHDKLELYKDVEGKFRWRRTAPNGEIVGAATEGYVNKADCLSNLKRQFIKPDNDVADLT